jgi:FAD:protein FMN transferase
MAMWLSLLTASALAGNGLVIRTEPILSTSITVALPPKHIDLADEVFAVFRDVEYTANEWRPGTPLAAVNAGAGGPPVRVPDDLRTLLHRGVELSELTGGAFDLTWGSLWGLWDFNTDNPVVPSVDERRRRVARIDYRRIEIDDEDGAVRLPEGMVIGLGELAKGQALDRAAALLDDRGVNRFSLTAGGQILVRGLNDERPWRVGIRDPRGEPGDYFAIVEVTDTSVSTSGDYERFFVVDGVRYHHILNPRTGSPTRGLRSATVICADATAADGLSTAVMVLGRERGLALIESLDYAEAVLVDKGGEVHRTTGASVTPVHEPVIAGQWAGPLKE